jgi:hypothetical protein
MKNNEFEGPRLCGGVWWCLVGFSRYLIYTRASFVKPASRPHIWGRYYDLKFPSLLQNSIQLPDKLFFELNNRRKIGAQWNSSYLAI